jgi:hypothetical protein
MKTIILKFTAVAVVLVSVMTSCKKDKNEDPITPTPKPVEKGTVTIDLTHKWGFSNETDFVLGTDLIHPMKHDTLNFTKLKYYISNVKLKKADGTWFTQTESYHLVDLSDVNSLAITLNDVPVGDYTDVYFTMGVDSTRNVSGAQAGALATSNGMFWSWNSGYIMLKAEGTSVNSTSGSFAFHLGGFSGVNNIVTEKYVQFAGNNLTVSSNHTSSAFLQVNPGWLWHSAPSVSVLNTIHMPGTDAKTMADGFFTNNSITLDHIVE